MNNQRMAKKLVCLALALLIGISSAAPIYANDQPSPWAEELVSYAVEMGLVPQNLQSRYTQPITRAEFTALAVRLYESERGEIAGRMFFNDTNDVNVQKMGYLGVITGVGGGNFDPNATLTREQAAVILSRLLDAMGRSLFLGYPLIFADNSQVSPWAIESVNRMSAAGIMSGVGNNLFAPSGSFTREQSIVTIVRISDAAGYNSINHLLLGRWELIDIQSDMMTPQQIAEFLIIHTRIQEFHADQTWTSRSTYRGQIITSTGFWEVDNWTLDSGTLFITFPGTTELLEELYSVSSSTLITHNIPRYIGEANITFIYRRIN